MDWSMLSVRSVAAIGLLLAVPAILSVPGSPVSAQGERVPGAPVEVTSDTREYCLKLLDRVSDMVRLSAAPIPPEITMLSTKGEKLCDNGQLRGGILRLRRALVMMEQGDGAAYR
jgi:hypothetical protein